MKKKRPEINIEDTFWGRFKTSEQLEEFFRPALIKAAAAQDKMRAEARALREAKAAAAASDEKPDPETN